MKISAQSHENTQAWCRFHVMSVWGPLKEELVGGDAQHIQRTLAKGAVPAGERERSDP